MKPIKDPELYVALSKVEDLLEKGWIKGNLKTRKGYCVQGAIDEVCFGQVGQQDLWEKMRMSVAKALPRAPRHSWSVCSSVTGFNDNPKTTFDDVRLVLRKARESAL